MDGRGREESVCLSPTPQIRERDRLTSSMASWSWVNLSMSLREEREVSARRERVERRQAVRGELCRNT